MEHRLSPICIICIHEQVEVCDLSVGIMRKSVNNMFITDGKTCWEILPLGGPEVFYVVTYKWS